MDNLGDLFKVAPTTAGFMLGGQMAQNDATQELKRRETLQDIMAKQQTYDQNTQMNPLLVEKQRTLNQGYGLDNEKQTIANRTARETQASDISSHIAKNEAATLKSHIEKAQQTEEFFNRAADQLKYLPPAVRSSWLAQAMADNGIDPKHPAVQQLVIQASQNPALLAQHAGAIAQERAARMPEYLKMVEEERLKGKNSLAVAQEHSRGQAESSRIIANGRVSAAQARAGAKSLSIQEAVRMGKISLDRLPAAFEQAASETDDPEEKALYLEQARKAEALTMNKPNARGSTEVNNGSITTVKPEGVYGGGKPPPGHPSNPIKIE